MHKVSLADALPILEASLGLSQKSFSHYQRVMDYYSALLKAGEGFFFESFKKDPLYVTGYLLKLRDELMMNGWNGNSLGISRIDDLAKVEKNFTNSTGYPERMKRVIAALHKPRKYQLPPISLICHKSSLSKLELSLVEASKLTIEENKKTLKPISYYEFSSSYDGHSG